MAETAGDLTAMIQQGTDTGQDILEAAEQRIYAIRQGRAARGLTPISDVLIDVYDRLSELAASESAIPGIVVGAFVDDKKSGRYLNAPHFTGMTLEAAVKKAEAEFDSPY